MKNITSIGEILFDVYPDGKQLGGAPFNFIYHIFKLTGQGKFISRVGNDDLGNEIIDFLKTNNISSEFIQLDEQHKTGVAKPALNESKIPDWTIELNRAYDFIELNDKVENLISKNSDCLCFGTLAQREEKSRSTIQSLFNEKIKYFCDLNIRQKFYSKDVIEKSLNTADVLKLNMDEIKLVNGILLEDEFELKNTAQKLIQKYKIDMLCVTNGENGSYLFTKDEENHYKVKVDDIVDTVGAGDAYSAILCIGYLNGWKLSRINKNASEFAAEVVRVNGALPKDESIYENFRDKINNE